MEEVLEGGKRLSGGGQVSRQLAQQQGGRGGGEAAGWAAAVEEEEEEMKQLSGGRLCSLRHGRLCFPPSIRTDCLPAHLPSSPASAALCHSLNGGSGGSFLAQMKCTQRTR